MSLCSLSPFPPTFPSLCSPFYPRFALLSIPLTLLSFFFHLSLAFFCSSSVSPCTLSVCLSSLPSPTSTSLSSALLSLYSPYSLSPFLSPLPCFPLLSLSTPILSSLSPLLSSLPRFPLLSFLSTPVLSYFLFLSHLPHFPLLSSALPQYSPPPPPPPHLSLTFLCSPFSLFPLFSFLFAPFVSHAGMLSRMHAHIHVIYMI